MNYIILKKAKRVYVPASGSRKAYTRYDPRTKVLYHSPSQGEKVIDALKNILKSIGILKKKGLFSKEQKVHVRRKLKELEPKLKYFKQQKQRMAVAKIMKQIREELAEKEKPKARTKDRRELPVEVSHGIKKLGYTGDDIKKMSLHEAQAIYWNDIRKE